MVQLQCRQYSNFQSVPKAKPRHISSDTTAESELQKMTSIGELKLDLEEVSKLLGQAQRQRVRGALSIEKGRLEAEIGQREAAASAGGGGEPDQAKQKPTTGYSLAVIRTYGWDQSEKFVKIYVTLQGVSTIPSGNVSIDFDTSSFKLLVRGLRNSNHQLIMNGLLSAIVPKESHYKIKTDSVVVFLKKAEPGNTWAYLTQVEKKVKDKKDSNPKMDADKDPGAGMMDLMKKMYDEGDDEMKRSIAKAWTESRGKQTPMDM